MWQLKLSLSIGTNRGRAGAVEMKPGLSRPSPVNGARLWTLAALRTRTPEGSVIRKNNMTTAVANLPTVPKNPHWSGQTFETAVGALRNVLAANGPLLNSHHAQSIVANGQRFPL